jgi:PleD family two-component response regulator
LVSRLAQRVAERTAEEGWPVTISAGIADSQDRARHIDALIAAADRQMYDAKAIKHAAHASHA